MSRQHTATHNTTLSFNMMRYMLTHCFVHQSDNILSSAANTHIQKHCKTTIFPSPVLRPMGCVCMCLCVRMCVYLCLLSRLAQHVLRRKFPKQNTCSSAGRRATLLILTDYPTSVLFPFTLSFSTSLLASCWHCKLSQEHFHCMHTHGRL